MPQIIDQNALKNKNTGTNIKKPWNWFGTIGLIIVFIYGKIRIPVTEPIDAKSAVIATFIIFGIGFLLCLIGIIKGRKKRTRGNWTGIVGIILVVIKLALMISATIALMNARDILMNING